MLKSRLQLAAAVLDSTEGSQHSGGLLRGTAPDTGAFLKPHFSRAACVPGPVLRALPVPPPQIPQQAREAGTVSTPALVVRKERLRGFGDSSRAALHVGAGAETHARSDPACCTASRASPVLCSQTTEEGRLPGTSPPEHTRLPQHSLLAWLRLQKVGVGVDFVSLGDAPGSEPSWDFLGQRIDDPALYVLEDRVGVLVPVNSEGLPIELLQLRGIPVEQVHFELNMLFGILWVLQETVLDFRGWGWLVHEVVPTREEGKQVTRGPAQRAGEKGASVLLLTKLVTSTTTMRHLLCTSCVRTLSWVRGL